MQEITVSTSSIQLGQIRLQSPIGAKKTIRSGIVTQLDRKSADGDFLQLGPWRSGKQLWIDLGESSQVILKRGRPIFNIFGVKAHANVLKGAFSTDCKSNCIKIGLILKIEVACICGPRTVLFDGVLVHVCTLFAF